MGELTDAERNQVIGAKLGFEMVEEGLTEADILESDCKKLKKRMSLQALATRLGHSKGTIQTILRKFKETGATTICKRSGRPLKLTNEHLTKLDNLVHIEGNNKLSIGRLQEQFTASTETRIYRQTFNSYLQQIG